jgi:Flp pilus assembly protein TadG
MRQISSNKRIARADEQGSVIVELALTLPLLAILILGSIDMGVIVREHQLLQNAAREGARFSAQPKYNIDPTNPSATANAIRDKVVSYLAQENIAVTVSACTADATVPKQWNCAMTSPSGGSLTIRQQYPIDTVVGGVTIRDYGSAVTVTYPRALLFPGGPVLGFNSVSLTGSAVFHNLYGN